MQAKKCVLSYTHTMNLTLQNNTIFQVVGPSGSGKTLFVTQLLLNSEKLFQNKINRIYWLQGSVNDGGESGITKNQMVRLKHRITYLKGFVKGWQDKAKRGDAIVIDDLFMESTKETSFNNLFTKIARHRGVTVIFITQNMFHQGGNHRTRNLNVHYLVLFKNPRDQSVIDFIARQAYPTNKKFLISAFQDATENKPYGYLFIDFTQTCLDSLRVRTDIFNPQGITVYKQT